MNEDGEIVMKHRTMRFRGDIGAGGYVCVWCKQGVHTCVARRASLRFPREVTSGRDERRARKEGLYVDRDGERERGRDSESERVGKGDQE